MQLSHRSSRMSSPGLVIRNGTIVDGTGGDPYEADLAVADFVDTARASADARPARKTFKEAS